jgi:hypothetical protein
MSRGCWKSPGLLVGGAILLGLLLRCYHYFRDPVVWHDEAALLVNVLPLGFGELLGPLRHAEAAPPLFLWVERATALTLGDSTLALRLPSFLASLAALGLVAWTTWREVGPAAAAWAALLIATSDRLLWHACEAKSYSFDVLCAAGLLALFTATRTWRLERRALAFVPLMPLVVWVSYPGCFLCGGLLAALLPAVWRDRRPASVAAFATLALAVVGSFTLLYFGPARAQRCAEMDSCWTGQFADWGRPWYVPLWTFCSTFDVVRYCFMPWGFVLGGYAIVGGIQLCRAGRADFVTLAVAPLGLNLLAAWLHCYPYGAARVVVHAAPALAILIAAGVAPSLNWLRAGGRTTVAIAALMLLIPAGFSTFRVAVPWYRTDCAAAADYALAHRSADEAVFGNLWQFEYYCREIGDHFAYVDANLSFPDGRTWVLLTAYQAEERAATVAAIARQRRLLDYQDYDGAAVILLDSLPQSNGSENH